MFEIIFVVMLHYLLPIVLLISISLVADTTVSVSFVLTHMKMK